jgi:ribose 5-phosphate isomerase B
MKTIYIGADHNGFAYKEKLVDVLRESGYTVVDVGNSRLEPVDDYPVFAGQVVASLSADNDPDSKGILICGSGHGVCIAANRFRGMRACVCWNVELARVARNDDDSNILCLSARYVPYEDTLEIVKTWLETPFAGAVRFRRRLQEVDELQ